MIESYSFGRIVIDGKAYTRDLILYPDRVDEHWWRKEGHRLQVGDLEEVFRARPDTLIVGTGAIGVMKISPEVEARLKEAGIELITERTEEACQQFNELSSQRKVVAALHLTC